MSSDSPGLSVSVALCTRNGARFVERQLQSILAQTVPVSQIVVSDDASTDDTLAIVDRVLDGPQRSGTIEVAVLSNAEALGVAGNFEQAILACSSELVALSDQDDEWHKERIERMLAAFDRDPETTLLHSNARLVDERGAVIGPDLLRSLDVTAWERRSITEGDALAVFLRRNLVTGATTIFRRSLADTALPVPPGWVHDEWLGIVAAANGRVTLLDEQLTDYRQHGANEIGAARLTMRSRFDRIREQGRERNARLLTRAESLARRFGEGRPSTSEAAIEAARQKLAHERIRSALPSSRLARVGRVARESRAGGYRRFGRGWIDVVRDLVQPL